MKIAFVLNGEEIRQDVPGDRRAVDLFREDLGLTGVKEGCGSGECGACTILVDGRTRLSCLMLAAQLDGRRVTTIEGLSADGTLHPVQTSFVAHGAVQCGFCTPGMVLTAAELLERRANPSRREIASAISGNLCRCTGYQKILDAVQSAASTPPPSPPVRVADKPAPAAMTTGSEAEQQTVFRPGSLDELRAILAAHPETRMMAGGTDLLVWLRSRRIEPAGLVCLDRIDSLKGISETGDGVRIGACTSHADILESETVRRCFPVLAQAVETLGSPHIRRMGTVGGNIVTASPAGDTLPPLYVLGAQLELQSAHGVRRMPIEAFIRGPGQTALEPGEILSAVVVPKPGGVTHQHFEKVGLRKAMACSVASLAAVMAVSGAGRIKRAALAWGSVGPTVVRLPELESVLVGKPLARDTLEQLMPSIRNALSPIDDVRASAAYRRQVATNLLLRLLRFAPSAPGEPSGVSFSGTGND